jgi:hypothetical protein
MGPILVVIFDPFLSDLLYFLETREQIGIYLMTH